MTSKNNKNKKNKNKNKNNKNKNNIFTKGSSFMYNLVNKKILLAIILFILIVLSLYINKICIKKENFAIPDGVCKVDVPELPVDEPVVEPPKKCDAIPVHGEVDELIRTDVEEAINEITESFIPEDCCSIEKLNNILDEIQKIRVQPSEQNILNETELLNIETTTGCSVETIYLLFKLKIIIENVMITDPNADEAEKQEKKNCILNEIVKLCNNKSSTASNLNLFQQTDDSCTDDNCENSLLMEKCGQQLVYILVTISDNEEMIENVNNTSEVPTDDEIIQNIISQQIVEGMRNTLAQDLNPYELSELIQNIDNIEPSIKTEISETVLDKVQTKVKNLKNNDKVIEKIKNNEANPFNEYKPKHYIEAKTQLKKYVDENKLVFECQDIF